jgi:phospholipid/cholesterol/gamma-HCH transport system substrate-binding protein
MSGRRLRWLAWPAAVALVGALATGCTTSSAPQHTATAVFNDIGDLANGAQVQMADVPVGTVSNIALDGNKAKITLTFNNGVHIPADVSVAIDRTTILGDQFVQLVVPKQDVGAGAASVPRLADGAVIHRTTTVPDVEQFVQAGGEVFGAVSATQLEQIITAGGEGFTGSEASLKSFLTNLSTVANAYAAHTGDITQAVNGLNSLSATLAPNSSANAQAITTLAQTVTILAQNSSQFENLLSALNNVSIQGRSILETYYPQITDQLQALQAVSSQLAQHQSDLAGLLAEIPVHDAALPSSVRNGFVQLYENIIVCGLPGGGEVPSSAAFTCSKNAGANAKAAGSK